MTQLRKRWIWNGIMAATLILATICAIASGKQDDIHSCVALAVIMAASVAVQFLKPRQAEPIPAALAAWLDEQSKGGLPVPQQTEFFCDYD